MKRVYVNPTMLIVQLNIKHHLLEGTQLPGGEPTPEFDTKGVSRDKYGRNVWDEEW